MDNCLGMAKLEMDRAEFMNKAVTGLMEIKIPCDFPVCLLADFFARHGYYMDAKIGNGLTVRRSKMLENQAD